MDTQSDSDFTQIDPKTSRSICDAVGERLQQNMRPDAALTPDLQRLIDEMKRRETGAG